MGLFDLLSKDGRARSAFARYKRKISAKHAQSYERFEVMEKLAALGTEEALYVLCTRFEWAYDKTIEDEQEKQWAHDTLAQKGEVAVAAVRRYALSGSTLGHALPILQKLLPARQLLQVIDEIIEREEPGYTRDPSRKIQLLTFLAEWDGESHLEIAKRILPYVADFDETVRFNALESLSHHPDEESSKAAVLNAMLRPEEESRRIKVRAADLLATAGWRVTERKEEIQALLADTLGEFTMQNDRLVRADKKRKGA